MRVILCGYHWTGCKALSLLLQDGHQVYVFTHDSPAHVPSLIDYAESLNVPYSVKRIRGFRLPFKPDIICSVYYRHIIPIDVIDACGGRIFNLHPSLLPAYRGCSSLTWAMVNGETQVGFTYHYVDAGIDTGNILIQQAVAVEPFDTQETLYTRVMYLAMGRFSEAFALVARGEPGRPQGEGGSFYRRGAPLNGEIDGSWNEEKVRRFIRAMTYPPYPPASYLGRPITSYQDYLLARDGSAEDALAGSKESS